MKNLNALSIGISILLLTACGTQSTSTNGTTASNSTTTTTTTTTSSPSPSPSPNVNNLPAAYQTLVQISGTAGSNPTFTVNSLTTSHTLKVKINALSAPSVPGTAFTYAYGCLSVQVTVDGSTQQSVPVAVQNNGYDMNCNGTNFSVLDFSNVMTGNNLGNGSVSVSVHDAYVDNCPSYYYTSLFGTFYGCGMIPLAKVHMAALNLTVETDGTYDPQISGQ